MSRSGRLIAPFGDGKHAFRLSIEGLEELQEKCDAGPEWIMGRISSGQWLVQDIRETLRLGLVGEGMDQFKALTLIERYAGPGQLARHKPLCAAIIGAAIVGAADEDPPPGEATGEMNPSPEESGGSDISTPSAAPSASLRRRSRKRPSGG